MRTSSEPALALRRGVRSCGAALALLLLAPAIAAAQGGPGFLFKRPVASLTLRTGWAMPSEGSQIFDFTREQLTVDKGDFSTLALGGDLAVHVSDRFDVGIGVMYANAERRSEQREWVGEDDLPIEQTTGLARVPLTANLKAYLIDRGRSVGRFAWIPSRFAPFVGVGAGAMWYRFEQQGEFVDYLACEQGLCEIFADTFESSGWAPTAHAFAGADFSLSPRFVLTGEARYGIGKAEMGQDFVDFDDIDLAGFQATVGVSVRF